MLVNKVIFVNISRYKFILITVLSISLAMAMAMAMGKNEYNTIKSFLYNGIHVIIIYILHILYITKLMQMI